MEGNPHLVKTAQASQATLKVPKASSNIESMPISAMSFVLLLELQKHSTGLSCSQELHRHDLEVGGRLSLAEEEDLEKMLGHFVDGETGDGGERDVNENWEEHGDLMKEIRWTKENLEQTMQLLKDCVNDNQTEKSRAALVVDNRSEEAEEVGKTSFTKMEIGRLLDNMDGYVAPRDDGFANKSISSISSPPLFSCEDSESDHEDLFEDSTDGVEEMQVSPDVQHVVAQVIPHPTYQEDSSVYESSPETRLPSSPTETGIPQPPSAPLRHCMQPAQEKKSVVVEEEDEILIVSTSSHVHQLSHHHTADPIQAAVERMAGDMEHLRARVSSLETILSLRSKLPGEQSLQSWWPLPGLNPRWPMV